MQTDGPRTLKISMGYFWNMFLPILTFLIFSSILLLILQWPDDTLDVISKNVRPAFNMPALDPK